MSVFGDYAKYYDLLYQDKDYKKEAEYINSLIKRFSPKSKILLEMGCGTGIHAILLAKKGYKIDGIDFSAQMLRKADERIQAESKDLASKLSFEIGDVRDYRNDKKYDAAISLFHIFSYQSTNGDLLKTMQTARAHLKKDGVLIFDCWYGPAVLTDRPVVRVKEIESEEIKIKRIARPDMFANDNLVDVNYETLVIEKRGNKNLKLKETHRMRYLFKPEVENFLGQANFKLIGSEEWLTGNDPGFDTWSVCFIAVAI